MSDKREDIPQVGRGSQDHDAHPAATAGCPLDSGVGNQAFSETAPLTPTAIVRDIFGTPKTGVKRNRLSTSPMMDDASGKEW